MVRFVLSALIAFTVTSGSTHCLEAQQLKTEKLYGQGVHEFFNDKHEEAIAKFDAAIKAGTDDPRVYYFRGLANASLKKNDAAKNDFARGADLEQARINMTAVINDSLQRVQGKLRLALETARSERLKQLEELRIKNMRVRVSSPYDSIIPDNKAETNGNPNLPDSSKTKDPTSPFPNLTIRPLQKTTEEKKEAVDVFGRKDPVKKLDAPVKKLETKSSVPAKANPVSTEKAEKPAENAVPKKTEKKSSNPFDK